jgi:hypothetical protein
MNEVAFDAASVVFPGLGNCHGIVYVNEFGLFAYHAFGVPQDSLGRHEAFASFVRNHIQGGGKGVCLYGACPSNRYTTGDKEHKAELKIIADALKCVCSCYLGGKSGRCAGRLKGPGKSTPFLPPRSWTMPARLRAAEADQTRQQRIEALMEELGPKVAAAVRRLVERAMDVPEAEEFGAIDTEFRDAGQALVNDVRQATLASRKKRGT